MSGRHRHPRRAPQLRAGDQLLRLAHMSATGLVAIVDAGFTKAVENTVARERRWRTYRAENAPLPPVSTARTRRRERRHPERGEKE